MNVFERAEQLKDRRPGEPHPFVASQDFSARLEELLANGEKKLEWEKKAEAGGL